MSILSKIFIFLLVIMTNALGVAVILVHSDVLKLKERAASAEADLQKATVTMLAKEREEGEKAKSVQEREKEDEKVKADLRTRLAQVTNDVEVARRDVLARDAQLALQSADLTRSTDKAARADEEKKKFQADADSYKAKLDESKKEYADINGRLTQLEIEKAYLLQLSMVQKERIEDLTAQLAAPRDAAAPGAVAVPAAVRPGPPIKGSVKAVAEDMTMATINVGASDGVQPEMKFAVFRGDKFLADLVITRVDAKYSVGRLEMVKAPVQVNDNAWNKLTEH